MTQTPEQMLTRALAIAEEAQRMVATLIGALTELQTAIVEHAEKATDPRPADMDLYFANVRVGEQVAHHAAALSG